LHLVASVLWLLADPVDELRWSDGKRSRIT
jgi:hypothetical protein